MKLKNTYFIFMIFFAFSAKSQDFVPLQKDFVQEFDHWNISKKKNFTDVVKPYFITDSTINSDSIFSFGISSILKKRNYFARKWTYEPLVKINEDGLKLNVDPLFDFSVFKDKAANVNYFTNSRGVRVNGNISNEFYFETSFIETQASFPGYITDYIYITNVSPGQGQARKYSGGFGPVNTEGFDYSIASGSFGFRIKKHFILSAGHGKTFIGNGYRSVLLSDNSYNYPFLRIDAHYGKFAYTRIMAILMGDSIPASAFGVREKKLGSFNILTFKPTSFFHLSLFEGTIWEYPNSRQNKDFDLNFYNPVIFSNSIFYKKNHFSLLGLNLKIDLFKTFSIYGQAGSNVSEHNNLNFEKSIAYQYGLKYFDVLGLKNLYFQCEQNFGNEGIANDKILPYSNYSQSLAHPMGMNFQENLLFLKYRFRNFAFSANYQKAEYGDKDFKKPVIKHPYTKTFYYTTPIIGAGLRTETEMYGIQLHYILNAFSHRCLEIGFTKRNAKIENKNYLNNIFYISFKTSINQYFYDF